MTGSDRLSSSAQTQLRAPYAAPRNAGVSVRAEARVVTAMLAPFVPREFRDAVNHDASPRDFSPRDFSPRESAPRDFAPRNSAPRDAASQDAATRDSAPRGFTPRDVTVVPVVERSAEVLVSSRPMIDAGELLSQDFALPVQRDNASHDARLESDFGAIAHSEFQASNNAFAQLDAAPDTAELPSDLPWIDAFTEAEPEDTWPMGEAGKRLDELTQSLTSLDESRARQQAEQENKAPVVPEVHDAEHAMWNEEEWIDIMPTPLMLSSSAELNDLVTEATPAVEPVVNEVRTNALMGAESAARALEGLAQRVRAGQVQVPAFNANVADEAMLAGLLASMLGWRQ